MAKDDSIRKLVTRHAEEAQVAKRQAKTTRTFRAREPAYSRFAAYCNWRGIELSDVLADLVDAYLEAAKDDMPPDDVLDAHRVKKRTPGAA